MHLLHFDFCDEYVRFPLSHLLDNLSTSTSIFCDLRASIYFESDMNVVKSIDLCTEPIN